MSISGIIMLYEYPNFMVAGVLFELLCLCCKAEYSNFDGCVIFGVFQFLYLKYQERCILYIIIIIEVIFHFALCIHTSVKYILFNILQFL